MEKNPSISNGGQKSNKRDNMAESQFNEAETTTTTTKAGKAGHPGEAGRRLSRLLIGRDEKNAAENGRIGELDAAILAFADANPRNNLDLLTDRLFRLKEDRERASEAFGNRLRDWQKALEAWGGMMEIFMELKQRWSRWRSFNGCKRLTDDDKEMMMDELEQMRGKQVSGL